MIRLDRILVPTDFSENGKCGLQYATALAEKFNSELHLLHVLDTPWMGVAPEPGYTLSGEFATELKASAETALRNVVGSEILAGKKVVSHLRRGVAFVEIIRYAREELIDLIVISTHGRTGLAHVLMGSVAERVVHKAACPVLTVRPSGHQFVMP